MPTTRGNIPGNLSDYSHIQHLLCTVGRDVMTRALYMIVSKLGYDLITLIRYIAVLETGMTSFRGMLIQHSCKHTWSSHTSLPMMYGIM